VARKTCSLGPYTETHLAPAKAPAGPKVPSDSVPRRKSSVPPPSEVMGGGSKGPKHTIAYNAKDLGIAPPTASPTAKAPQKTIAYNANDMGLAPPEPASEPPKKKKAPQKTIAYDAKELGLMAPSAPASPPAEQAPAKKKKAPSKTIAYDAKELGLMAPSGPASPPAEQAPEREAPAKKKAPSKTIAYDAKELGLAPPSLARATPEPASSAKMTIAYDAKELGIASPQQSEAPSQTEDVGGPVATLMHSRDGEPSQESPLLYRERVFHVAPGTTDAIVEALIYARFDELVEELADRPKGKLFNLAIFDHEWDGRPDRPPLITLQWKDWRGDPVVQRPGTPGAQAAPAPSQPPAAAAPSQPPPASTPPPAASNPPPAAASNPPPAASSPPPAAASNPPPAVQAAPSQPPSQPPVAAKAAPTPRAKSEPPQSDDRLVTAFEALQDLFFLTSPIEGLEFTIKLLEDLIPSEAASACLYDINTDELRFVSLSGPGADERKGEGIPRLSGLLGVAALDPARPHLIEDAASDDRYDPGADGRVGIDAQTLAVVALNHQGRLLGALQLINRQQQAQYSRADGNLLYYVAEKLAEFLHAARMRPARRM